MRTHVYPNKALVSHNTTSANKGRGETNAAPLGIRAATFIIATVTLFSTQAYSLYISSVKISSLQTAPVEIQCGLSAGILIEVNYYAWSGDQFPLNPHVSLIQSGLTDKGAFSHTVAEDSFRIAAAGEGKAEITLYLHCTPQKDGKCSVYGDLPKGQQGTTLGGSPYTLEAECEGLHSEKFIVSCAKPDTQCAYVLPTSPIHPGGKSVVSLALQSPKDSIGLLKLSINYPPTAFTLAGLNLNPAFTENVSTLSIDTSSPGKIGIITFLRRPVVFPVLDTIGTFGLKSASIIPYGLYLVSLDTSSHFYGVQITAPPIDALMGEQNIALVPDETIPPVIDTTKITITRSGITGKPSAIRDAELDTIPGWVDVALVQDDTGYIDHVAVDSSGSFSFNDTLLSGLHLSLVATNGAGDSTRWRFTPVFPTLLWFQIPEGPQTIYAPPTGDAGPIVFTIGAEDSLLRINDVFTDVIVKRKGGIMPESTSVQLPPIELVSLNLYGNYWHPQTVLLPGDTVKFKFNAIDSLGVKWTLDSNSFKITIAAADTTTTYSRTLTSACQYVFELTDTTGRQVDSTRKPPRPNDTAAGLIHIYNTWCGPSAAASCLAWLGEGKVDTSFVDSLAELFGTDVKADGTNPVSIANGAKKKLDGRYSVHLWMDSSVFIVGKRDSGVIYSDSSPTFNKYSSELKDSEDVIISIGWWQDSAGVKIKRQGGHFVTGNGFRPDGHLVTGATVNDSTGFIEIMDPDCGRFRWVKWRGANANGLDSIDYPGLSAGMIALVESMISISKIPQGSGIGEVIAPQENYITMRNIPNPFSTVTRFLVQTPLLRSGTVAYTLKVYDELGREVADLSNAAHDINDGTLAIDYDPRGLPQGVYFYTFQIGRFSVTKQMLLLR